MIKEATPAATPSIEITVMIEITACFALGTQIANGDDPLKTIHNAQSSAGTSRSTELT